MTTWTKRTSKPLPRRRGSALLAVLWLSAALSAIAYSLANTVRAEVERTSTDVDGLRSYYLARAGVERGILYMQWGNGAPPNAPFKYKPGMPLLPFTFPSGQALVEIIPETAKLNINTAAPLELFRLLLALGTDPPRAEQIVAAIVDWRSPAAGTPFDAFYQSLTPSFRARHASFEETEELLLLRGMTRELYYGGYYHDANGRLVPHGGLRDCVSVFGSKGARSESRLSLDRNRAVQKDPPVVARATRRSGSFLPLLHPCVVAAMMRRRRSDELSGGRARFHIGEARPAAPRPIPPCRPVRRANCVRQTAKQPRVRRPARGLLFIAGIRKQTRGPAMRGAAEGLAEGTTTHQTSLRFSPVSPTVPTMIVVVRIRREGGSVGKHWALHTRLALGAAGEAKRRLCAVGHILSGRSWATVKALKRGNRAMKKFIALAILVGLVLLGGTATTVVLDTEAAWVDGCNGKNC